MKKQIITGIAVIACVALCAAVWPRSVKWVEDLLTEPVKTAVIGEIEARSEEMPPIFLSDDTYASEPEAVAESEPTETDLTAEKETPIPESAQETKTKEVLPTSGEPRMGDVRVVNGEKQIYILGFGWIKDEGGGAQGTTVGSPGDELTGNKIGQMGEDDTPPSEKSTPAPGTKAVIDGKPSVWIPGFGWIEDNGGGNVGTVAEDMYENGHKIGIMD